MTHLDDIRKTTTKENIAFHMNEISARIVYLVLTDKKVGKDSKDLVNSLKNCPVELRTAKITEAFKDFINSYLEENEQKPIEMTDSEQSRIGHNIKCLRTEKGLSKKDILKKTGIDVSGWEKGIIKDMTVYDMRKLAEVMNVDINNIFS